MTYLFIAATAWLLAVPVLAGSARKLPQEVWPLAKQRGCSLAVASPNFLGPIAVFGFLPGPTRDSAVFWCERHGSASGLSLVVWQSRQAEQRNPFSCKDEIHVPFSPGRLSVGGSFNESLRDLLYLNSAEQGPDVTIPKARVIVVMNKQVSTFFVCHNGDWFFRHLD